MIYTIEGTGSFFSFTFSRGGRGGESSILPQQIQLVHLNADRKALCFDSSMWCFIRRSRKQQVQTSQPPLSQYHSRQIVFTLDPTTATKDPTCSSNNSKSNHIGFPFLVSKGHSLSWFFSFNSCKGIEPPPALPPKHPHSHPLSARESGGRNRGLSICTQTVGQPKKPQWIVTHYWNYQALIKLATLSPLGCAHLQLNFSSSDSNREAALAATGC